MVSTTAFHCLSGNMFSEIPTGTDKNGYASDHINKKEVFQVKFLPVL